MEMQRTRPFKIILFFLLCLAGLVSLLNIIVPNLSTNFPYHSRERYFADFDHRLTRYQNAHHQKQCKVIIGPSYAAMIGEMPNIYNLGMMAATPKQDIATALWYVRKQDYILYMFTIRELVYYSMPFNPIENCRPAIRLQIGRAYFRDALGLQLWPRNERNQYPKESFEKLTRCIGTAPGLDTYAIITEMGLYSQSAQYSLEPFIELRQRHPNILYVIHPVLPLIKPDDDTDDFSSQIRKVFSRNQQMVMMFEQSGLPFVDLSHCYPPSMFATYTHLTDAGLKSFREVICSL